MTEQCAFGLIVLKAKLQCQQDILDHGNGRICNLGIKVIGLASSQTRQLFCLLKINLHGPADLVDFNYPDERRYMIIDPGYLLDIPARLGKVAIINDQARSSPRVPASLMNFTSNIHRIFRQLIPELFFMG